MNDYGYLPVNELPGYDAWKTREPDYYEDPDDEPEEPTGSCDECGVNVYGSDLCDQCEWKRAVAAGEVKP